MCSTLSIECTAAVLSFIWSCDLCSGLFARAACASTGSRPGKRVHHGHSPYSAPYVALPSWSDCHVPGRTLFPLSQFIVTPLRYCSGLLHNKLNLWLCCVSQSCNVVAFPSFSHNCVMIYGNLGTSHPRCVLIYSFHKDRKTFSMFILLLYLISVVRDACVFDKILCFPRVRTFPCR